MEVDFFKVVDSVDDRFMMYRMVFEGMSVLSDIDIRRFSLVFV